MPFSAAGPPLWSQPLGRVAGESERFVLQQAGCGDLAFVAPRPPSQLKPALLWKHRKRWSPALRYLSMALAPSVSSHSKLLSFVPLNTLICADEPLSTGSPRTVPSPAALEFPGNVQEKHVICPTPDLWSQAVWKAAQHAQVSCVGKAALTQVDTHRGRGRVGGSVLNNRLFRGNHSRSICSICQFPCCQYPLQGCQLLSAGLQSS